MPAIWLQALGLASGPQLGSSFVAHSRHGRSEYSSYCLPPASGLEATALRLEAIELVRTRPETFEKGCVLQGGGCEEPRAQNDGKVVQVITHYCEGCIP